MKKQLVELTVGEDVWWDDDSEKWIVRDDFEYDPNCWYQFYCDVSNETMQVVKVDDSLEVCVFGDYGWDGFPYEEDEAELDELLERAAAVADEHAETRIGQ